MLVGEEVSSQWSVVNSPLFCLADSEKILIAVKDRYKSIFNINQ